MLVLSRKPGERILIGNEVVVEVVRLGPAAVRLGITAPPGVRVLREEIEPLTADECRRANEIINRQLVETR